MSSNKSYSSDRIIGLAVDPIHVGSGGARLGRVDNTIVRDPVTRVPKIPGSSLAGVYRSYAALTLQHENTANGGAGRSYYPGDAGQGSADNDGKGPINAVFGHRSFAGLAGFSDAHIVLFPVATRKGPKWIASPSSLRCDQPCGVEDDKVYQAGNDTQPLNLGWLLLSSQPTPSQVKGKLDRLTDVPQHIRDNVVVVSDKLFGHIINSNLEVRTSVSIDPATGAAKDTALFTYEAIPRGTVLTWDVTCRSPEHFTTAKDALGDYAVINVVRKAHELLEHLGIGGMGTRGMGRLRVLSTAQPVATDGAQ